MPDNTRLCLPCPRLQSLDPLLVSLIIAAVSTFVTEVTSNTACANILVPILSKVSRDWWTAVT